MKLHFALIAVTSALSLNCLATIIGNPVDMHLTNCKTAATKPEIKVTAIDCKLNYSPSAQRVGKSFFTGCSVSYDYTFQGFTLPKTSVLYSDAGGVDEGKNIIDFSTQVVTIPDFGSCQ